MNVRRTLAASALSALTLGGLGMGVAMALPSGATSPVPKPPAPTVARQSPVPVTPSKDSDNVQQGDQSGPDVAGAPEKGASSGGVETAQDPSGSEKPDQGSDNPAGHADPPGDAQHNGGATES